MNAATRHIVAGGAAVDPLIVIFVAFAIWACRERRRRPRGRGVGVTRSEAVPTHTPLLEPLPHAPTASELRRLSDWAFDYERMLLETTVTAAQRGRALHVLSRLITPLVGHVRLCDVDDELARSVGHVVAAQLHGRDGEYAVCLWWHFLRWARLQAAPPEAPQRLAVADDDSAAR